MDWPEDIKETTSDGDEEVYWSGINRILLEDEVREPENEAATSALPSKH